MRARLTESKREAKEYSPRHVWWVDCHSATFAFSSWLRCRFVAFGWVSSWHAHSGESLSTLDATILHSSLDSELHTRSNSDLFS